jgi:hypothetical protein
MESQMKAQLPSQAIEHIPEQAVPALVGSGGIETYATVDFVARETNAGYSGSFVEVDSNSWIESNFWHFEEVSETRDGVVLFDDSRGVTVAIDYHTNEISIYAPTGELALIYDVTGVDYSLAPVIPDGWIV